MYGSDRPIRLNGIDFPRYFLSLQKVTGYADKTSRFEKTFLRRHVKTPRFSSYLIHTALFSENFELIVSRISNVDPRNP